MLRKVNFSDFLRYVIKVWPLKCFACPAGESDFSVVNCLERREIDHFAAFAPSAMALLQPTFDSTECLVFQGVEMAFEVGGDLFDESE